MQIEAILGIVILLVLMGFVRAWSVVFIRLSKGRPIVPFEPRICVPWNGLLALAAFAIYLLFAAGAALLVNEFFQAAGTASERLTLGMAATGIATLLSALVIVLLFRLTASAKASDLGFRSDTLFSDIVLGIFAFLAAAPPVYLLQSLLVMLDDTAHPVVDIVKQDHSPSLFVWVTFTAVIAAPLVEELLFRVVLQGWLERMWKIGEAVEPVVAETVEDEFALPTDAEPTDELINPYRATGVEMELVSTESDTPGKRGLLPIALSSLIFALFHVGQGLAPISLFFLALVLGFLYQRTHRIVPCIVVHMLLNGTSMALLWWMLQSGQI